MFERYTEGARRVIFFARLEASALGQREIGAEVLLLGLAAEDPGILETLVAPGITAETFRKPILANAPAAPAIPTNVDLPLTNESKRVLAYANEEAERLGERIIRTGHLLLGLLREKDCWAAQLLMESGADLGRMRTRMAEEAQEPGPVGGRVRAHFAGFPQPPQGPEWVPEQSHERPNPAFQRYTVNARRVIFFARCEASHFGAGAIDPEHLLLGMIREAGWELYELLERRWRGLRWPTG